MNSDPHVASVDVDLGADGRDRPVPGCRFGKDVRDSQPNDSARFLPRTITCLRQPEVGVDQGHRLQRSGDGGARRQYLAELDLPDGEPPIEWSSNALLRDGGPENRRVCGGFAGGGLGGIEIGRGKIGTRPHAACWPGPRLKSWPARRLGLGRGELRLLGAGVEPHQNLVAAANVGAGVEGDLPHRSRQLGSNRHAMNRHQGSDGRPARSRPLLRLDLGRGHRIGGQDEVLAGIDHRQDLAGLDADENRQDCHDPENGDEPGPALLGPVLHAGRVEQGFAFVRLGADLGSTEAFMASVRFTCEKNGSGGQLAPDPSQGRGFY